MLLFLIAFIAGVLTVLAPCVLPLLPVIVGGSVSGGVNKTRAYTVALSLGVSVILFTLLLKFSTAFIGIPQYAWEWFSGGVLVIFGIITLFPQIWDRIGLVNKISRESNKAMSAGFMKQSFWGDVLVGAALGPVFSTCSPTYFVILATVLPASFALGFADLLAYTSGLVLMLLFVSLVGQRIVDKLGIAADTSGWFRKTIGALFIIVGVLVFSGAEAPLESWLITHVFDVTMVEQRLLQLQDTNSPATSASSTGDILSNTNPINDVGASTQATSSVGSAGEKSASVQESPSNVAATIAKKAMYYQKAPELASIDGYINTGTGADGKPLPITISQFKGKDVVLVDFWTYSCINCQRSLPYVEAWYKKYKDQGLVIIGVSTPEFAFEHVYDNVANAVKQDGLTYPVVLDNEYGTWNAFSNEYWPRDYLIDIDGYVVHDHAGEGDYATTEKAIQAALAERAQRLGTGMPTSGIATPQGVVTVDNRELGSPETYFGSSRNEYLDNGTPGQSGNQNLTLPQTPSLNKLYLGGVWNIADQYAESTAGAQIEYSYQAKGVYFVAGTADGTPMDVEVERDGKPLDKSYAGADIVFKNGKSYVEISGNRLYKIIEDSGYTQHVLKFTAPAAGLQAYTFTFG